MPIELPPQYDPKSVEKSIYQKWLDARVFHATTIATNAILEEQGVSTGLVTSEGFRYVLEIGRHDIPRAPKAVVARALLALVAERLA